MYLTDPDRHNITSDQLSHTNTQAITLNQDQTTSMIPESYFSIKYEKGKKRVRGRQSSEGQTDKVSLTM